jgi:hypothetical protein
VEPRPILAAPTTAETRAVIVQTLLRDGWVLEAEYPGEIVAHRDGSSWVMVISIRYGEQISISYLSSTGLEYQETQTGPVIHHGYNGRVDALMKDLAREVAPLVDPSTVSAPPPVRKSSHPAAGATPVY